MDIIKLNFDKYFSVENLQIQVLNFWYKIERLRDMNLNTPDSPTIRTKCDYFSFDYSPKTNTPPPHGTYL